MGSLFPNSIDSFTDPLANSPLNSPSHAGQHQNLNDAVEKVETYMGLVKVTSGTLSGTSKDVTSCFTSTYTNYRIVVDSVAFSGTADLYFRMLDGTTPETGTNYNWAFNGLSATNAVSNSNAFSSNNGFFGISISGANNLAVGAASFDVYSPNVASRTLFTGTAVGAITYYVSKSGIMAHNLTTAYTGIQFRTDSAVTMTGNYTVYGYRK